MKPSPYTVRYSPQEVDHYYRTGLWSTDTFHDILVRRVEENPDKVFATDGAQSLTFRELFDAGQRLAVGLHRRGLRRGDTAAVQLPNWVEFIKVLTALSRLGVIMVPIMPIYRREDVSYVLSNAGVRTVFTPAQFSKFGYLDMYRALRQEHPELTIVVARPDGTAEDIADTDSNVFTLHQLEADTDDASARAELRNRPGPDDPFVTVYTSETTSRPKGCVHTFNTYCAGARALVGPFGYTEADVQFGPSPIAHTTGLVTSVLLPMLTGAATHVMAKPGSTDGGRGWIG
jgi:acyl-coenzyme A synthetase/AMP-(fatty) acid ligase